MATEIWQKQDDVWVKCQRPYVKKNGVWGPAEEGWIKEGGVWKLTYDYDVAPPSPPVITLEVIEDFDTINGTKTLQTRYIKVGVRLPGVDDPDARLVRVLTNFNGKAPTSPHGGTFTTGQDNTWPEEPWSEWRYNSYGAHKDTANLHYKQWPRNYGAGQICESDKTYYFGGWTLDNSGNWSAGTQVEIHIPKASIKVPNVITKEARIQPNSTGSWRGFSGGSYQNGKLIQQNSPRSNGLWFYGAQFINAIGQQGTPTIKSAQIFVRRDEKDGGSANANIYLFWHDAGQPGSLPSTGPVKKEITKIGELAKGEGKWFPLPTAFRPDLNKNIRGMGLNYKHPDKADAFPADFSSVPAVADAPRCGEVHVVWEEEL